MEIEKKNIQVADGSTIYFEVSGSGRPLFFYSMAMVAAVIILKINEQLLVVTLPSMPLTVALTVAQPTPALLLASGKWHKI